MTRFGAPRVAAVVGILVTLAVVAGVWLTRPGGPDAPAPDAATRQASALTSALGRPPGTTSVDVGAGRDLRGYPYVATVVSLARSATGREVADVVAAMPAATRRAGLPASYAYRQLAFLTATGARLTVAWQPEVSTGALQRAAAGWLAVGRALGPDVDVGAIALTDGGTSYRLAVGASGEPDLLAVYATATAAAGSAGQDVGTADWELSGTAGTTSLRLSSSGPLDAGRQREWRSLLADAGRLGPSLAVSRLDVSFADRVETHLTVLAPDTVDDAGFTPAAYGGLVWPVVRPQLRTVSRTTDHWSYFLSWARRSRPGAEQLLALLFGDQGTVRDGTGGDRSPGTAATWADGARAFLTRGG